MKSSRLSGLGKTALAFKASTDNVTIGVGSSERDIDHYKTFRSELDKSKKREPYSFHVLKRHLTKGSVLSLTISCTM
jgi:hypothetical protein